MKLYTKIRCKKLIAMSLTIVMALGLAACKAAEDVPEPQPNQPPVVQNPDTTDTTDTNKDNDTTQDNVDIDQDATDGKMVVSSANERLKYILYQARDEETNDYMKSYSDDSAGFLSLLGISEEDVQECVVSTSMMNVKAYMIAIFKPSDVDGAADKITSALESYKQSMIDSFTQYLQDQMEVAENANIFATNGYIGIVMCEDEESVSDSITTALKNIDDIEIDETLPPQVKDRMSMAEIFEIWNGYQDDAEAAATQYNRDYFAPFKSSVTGDNGLKLAIDTEYELVVTFKEDNTPDSMVLTDLENDEHTVDLINESLDDFLNEV